MLDVTVIGAGVSGLSAGIYLQNNGFNVTIYEQCNTVGGNLVGWKRQGCTIDNCIHWLTGTNPNTKTYGKWVSVGALGNDCVYNAEYLYKSELNGETLALYYDIDKTASEMLALSPIDEKEITAFIIAVKRVAAISCTGGKNRNKKANFLQQLLTIPCLVKYYKINLYELSEKFKHPLIKLFFTDYIGGNFGAIAYIVTAAAFCGGNGGLPSGGSLKMAENMRNKFLSLGGNIVVGEKAVCGNYVKNRLNSITFESGKSVKSDYFILTGDPFTIYRKILNKPMPKQLANCFNERKFERFSSIHTAFAVPLSDLPFKGTYITDVPNRFARVLNSTRLKLREYSHEKSFATEEKTVIQTISFTNAAESRRWVWLGKDKNRYTSAKQEYANAVKDCIEEIFPSLKGKIEPLDCWTPYTYNRYTGAELGEYMSFSLPPKYIPRQFKNTVKGASNVVIASQWLTVPGGLPNALNVGIRASKTVERKAVFNKFLLKRDKSHSALLRQ